MTTFRRLQLAVILGLFAVTPLFATIFNTMVFWENHGAAYHLTTLLAVLFFAAALCISIMIGLDAELDDIPWLKLGLFLLFIVVGGLLGWIRYLVE